MYCWRTGPSKERHTPKPYGTRSSGCADSNGPPPPYEIVWSARCGYRYRRRHPARHGRRARVRRALPQRDRHPPDPPLRRDALSLEGRRHHRSARRRRDHPRPPRPAHAPRRRLDPDDGALRRGARRARRAARRRPSPRNGWASTWSGTGRRQRRASCSSRSSPRGRRSAGAQEDLEAFGEQLVARVTREVNPIMFLQQCQCLVSSYISIRYQRAGRCSRT